MTTTILDQSRSVARSGDKVVASWWQGLLRRAVLGKLRGLSDGGLIIVDDDSATVCGAAEGAPTITVHHPRFWQAIALGGSVGAGAAYQRGDWSSDDLVGVIRTFCRNREVLLQVDGGLGALLAPLRALIHRLNRNSIEGAARNIHAHYDIGNALYERMLDRTMMYSSAIFPHPGASLEEAQEHKNDLICLALDLQADDHLLEIGSGWGGFAIHAASRYGCRVTTTTISQEQYDLACRRVAEAGLSERVTVLKQDYRSLQGRYDKLVSIEMIEAVGHEYYPAFFRRCDELLADDGIAVLQAICIDDALYDQARREVDFIKRFIFPGCCIPSVQALSAAASRTSGLRLLDSRDYGPHYARTLLAWQDRCTAAADALEEHGFDAAFRRLWTFYLAYCAGGFAERQITVQHLRFAKQAWRGPAHEDLVAGRWGDAS